MTTIPRFWSCDRWGTAPLAMVAVADPNCTCSMCKARRFDALPKSVKGPARDRMRP